MPIVPLPQFEADAPAPPEPDEPKSVVVRFGAMGLIGEYPHYSDAALGCGTRLVVRSHRGTELAELLTTTCPNAGCGSSVTRQQMLEYIDRSGGRDYPFFSEGRVLRVATGEDLQCQGEIDASKQRLRREAAALAERLGVAAKIVDAEPILGGERLTFYYQSEERVDLRGLMQELRRLHDARIDLRQIGARDEARLTADYERCGQYCCCKQFLKVLKPVSMKSAKTQKATLDPLKISGRCGRLMCCLRYEDQTYEELKKNLPRRKSRVGTPDGDGTVIQTQILTQLALVRLDETGKDVAVPVEQLTEAGLERPKPAPPERRPRREPEPARESGGGEGTGKKRRRRRRKRKGDARVRSGEDKSPEPRPEPRAGEGGDAGAPGDGAPKKKRRRRRRRRKGGGGDPGGGSGTN